MSNAGADNGFRAVRTFSADCSVLPERIQQTHAAGERAGRITPASIEPRVGCWIALRQSFDDLKAKRSLCYHFSMEGLTD
jgi:hypothetical protein